MSSGYMQVQLDKTQAEKIQQKTHVSILFSKEELEWLGNEIFDLIGEDVVSNTISAIDQANHPGAYKDP